MASAEADRYHYKAEDNVPMPLQRRYRHPSGGFKWRYPLKILLVGQSFFVPAADLGLLGAMSITMAIASHQQRSDVGFAWRSRTTVDDGEDGIRVWRIK